MVEECLVWDNHSCMPLRPEDESFLPQLMRHKNAGFNVVSLNVTFDMVARDPTLGFRMLGRFRKFVARNSNDLLLVHSVDDVERARREGKLGVFFDIEGGVAIEPGKDLIQAYYDLGVRWMLIAYNRRNLLGSGCQDDNDLGLTDFGREVIDEMQRVGMVLCCTHTGERTSLEAIEYSRNPVVLSHSNPRAMHDHQRNVSDELLAAVARSGGVVSLNGIGLFLGNGNTDPVESFVRHVNYVADLIGPEHVGIGLDYIYDTQEVEEFIRDNPEVFPQEKGYGSDFSMVEPECMPEIVNALSASGWSEADLRGFLGENNFRVAEQVWK